MSTVKEPEVKWSQDQMIEVRLREPDDFLKVRETLTRIGVASSAIGTGDLTVNGTTVTNSATNTTIEDQLIELGTGNSGSASGDAGIIIERGDDDNVFIGWDESADTIQFATTTATGASSGDLSLTDANIKITVSGIFGIIAQILSPLLIPIFVNE